MKADVNPNKNGRKQYERETMDNRGNYHNDGVRFDVAGTGGSA
jgi:hypothetical protein